MYVNNYKVKHYRDLTKIYFVSGNIEKYLQAKAIEPPTFCDVNILAWLFKGGTSVNFWVKLCMLDVTGFGFSVFIDIWENNGNCGFENVFKGFSCSIAVTNDKHDIKTKCQI